MNELIPQNLRFLAQKCAFPLYLVGGSVRDFLAGFPLRGADFDLASPASDEAFAGAAEACGFTVRAVYPATGTVKIEDAAGIGYEYTRFRSDKYVRGIHTPTEIFFTEDIALDARRRDFCANAVYYDIAADRFADPLGGMKDIRKRILRTVAPAEKVFGEDGLRLLRLARIAAQTGFSPDGACLAGAQKNCALIRDIVPERVFHELDLLLHADEKHGGADGPYRGLAILRETGVLPHILPELAAGDRMAQRADFHAYDVLEHSFRCVRYAPDSIRWAALLHDVGKPYCMLRDGNFHAHPEEGARLAEEIMTRLKAPVRLTAETKTLVALHMRDFDLKMRESKVRREIVRAYPLLEKLFALRQADFSACKDNLSPAPSVLKWRRILSEMTAEGVPFTLAMLAVNGRDMAAIGLKGEAIGRALAALQDYCVADGRRNAREPLLARAKRDFAAPLCE